MKKAILVVSFGTSYLDTLKENIERAENQIKDYFTEYDIYRAFTSHKIIRKLQEKYELYVNTPEEMLKELYEDGYEEIIIQPLHLIPGEEFIYIKNVSEKFKSKFQTLKIGRPIFYYQGIEDLPQDYSLFIEATKELYENNKAVVLVGHGSSNPANSVYGCLQSVFEDEGFKNVFIGTVEGYPSVENVIRRIKEKNINEVTIAPLMLVAGDHARNDIASDEDDSWKTVLESEGIKVNLYMKGLGENEKFNKLYINRIEDVINNRYIGAGQTKKGHNLVKC